MSQANELLNGLTEGDVAMFTAEPEAEGHIVIGKDRFITIPEELKRIAVQRDHNIETVTFDCPRYWDEHDLMDMDIYINYKNANNVLGAYLAQNVTVDKADDSIIHFTWTISGALTTHKGNIVILVCAKVVDVATGEETLHWNSEINNDMYVSEGLEAVAATYTGDTDLYTQLITIVESAEVLDPMGSGINSERHNGVPKENASGTNSFVQGRGTIARGADQHARGRFNVADTENRYADIVGNGTSDSNRSNAYTLDWDGNAEFAGGIKAAGGLEADGRDILNELDKRVEEADTVVDDTVAYAKVVPDNALPNARLVEIGGMTRKCTNLLDISTAEFKSINGGVASVSGDTLTVTGNMVSVSLYNLKVGAQYTIRTVSTRTGEAGGGLALMMLDDSKNAFQGIYQYDSTLSPTITFEVPENTAYVRICFYGSSLSDRTNSATFKNIMLNEGGVVPYEPYFDGLRSAPVTAVESVYGNLFDSEAFSKNGKYYSFKVIPNKMLYRNAQLGALGDWKVYDSNGVMIGTFETLGFTSANNYSLLLPYNASYIATTDITAVNNAMIYIGYTVEPGPRYVNTLPIPEAVQALDGYGDGINETCYNHIDWEKKQFVKCVEKIVINGSEKWTSSSYTSALQISTAIPETAADVSAGALASNGYNVVAWMGGVEQPYFRITPNTKSLWLEAKFEQYADIEAWKANLAENPVEIIYPLATPEVTDISDLLSADNYIEVESGGTVTMVNEYRDDVPNMIEFYTSPDVQDAIGAKKIVGNLIGNASSANMAKRLSTPRTITLSGDVTGSTEFDGSDDITINATVKNLTHTHDNATESNAGFMSSADAKYIAKVKTTDLGNFKDKTLADLHTALVDWISTRANYPNATAVFSCETIQNIWNAGDLTAIFNAGAQWTVRLETSFGGNNYTQLQFSRYFDKDIYVAALSNGVWQKMHKIAYTDDQLNLSGGTLTGGLSTSAYKTDSGLTVETTPQFRNVVIFDAEPTSEEIAKLATGDLVFVLESDD